MGVIEEAEARGEAVTPEGLWQCERAERNPQLVEFRWIDTRTVDDAFDPEVRFWQQADAALRFRTAELAPAPPDDFLQWLGRAADRVRHAVWWEGEAI